MDISNNIILENARGEKREFDGLLINTKTAIVVEANHVAEFKHIKLVLDKASFLLEHAGESNADSLKGITGVVPVLASSRFSPIMIDLCKLSGVSIVKPNGSGHTFVPYPPPSRLIGRRLHTVYDKLARALPLLRVLLSR